MWVRLSGEEKVASSQGTIRVQGMSPYLGQLELSVLSCLDQRTAGLSGEEKGREEMIWRMNDLVNWSVSTEIKGRWVPARPINLRSWPDRIRETWLVFWGKADVVIWEENQ